MKNLNKRLIQATRYTYKSIRKWTGSDNGVPDPVIVQAYRGYTNGRRVFLKGRVLEDKGIRVNPHDGKWRNLFNTFKRFESDELPGVSLRVNLSGEQFDLHTDEEGYFTLRTELAGSLPPDTQRWALFPVDLLAVPGKKIAPVKAEAPVLFPGAEAEFGVISDIDDTVLRTYVTSTLGLRMLYATLFGNAHQRLPMEGIVELFQQLEKGSSGQAKNPFFYVSNSPWNMYDLLTQFMEVRQLPRGPVLLRDFGLSPANFSAQFFEHKQETIARILDTYPNLPFILMGDTGSKDVDHYLALAHQYREQIRSIYIRWIKNTANARRVDRLIRATTGVDIKMVKTSSEIFQDVVQKGYVCHLA